MLPQELARLSYEKMPMPSAVVAGQHVMEREIRAIDDVETYAATLFKKFDNLSRATLEDFWNCAGGVFNEYELCDGYTVNIDGYQKLGFNYEAPELQSLGVPNGYTPRIRTNIVRYLPRGYKLNDRIYNRNRTVSVMTTIGVSQIDKSLGEWRPQTPDATGWPIEGISFAEYFPSTDHHIAQCLPELSDLELAESEARNKAKTAGEIALGMTTAIDLGDSMLSLLRDRAMSTGS